MKNMKLSNKDLQYFIEKIKLQPENMGKYRDQINNLKQKLEKKIEILGIRENVFLAGNVHNVNEYLAKADIFVLSSDYEGLPLSILESSSSWSTSSSIRVELVSIKCSLLF